MYSSTADFWSNFRGKKGLLVVCSSNSKGFLSHQHACQIPCAVTGFSAVATSAAATWLLSSWRGDRHAMGLFIEHDVYFYRDLRMGNSWVTFSTKVSPTWGPPNARQELDWLLPFKEYFWWFRIWGISSWYGESPQWRKHFFQRESNPLAGPQHIIDSWRILRRFQLIICPRIDDIHHESSWYQCHLWWYTNAPNGAL